MLRFLVHGAGWVDRPPARAIFGVLPTSGS